MAQSRTAWWVPAVAACVLAYLGLTTYADVFGPGAIGARLRFRGGPPLVTEVVDGGPAAVAGLAVGDQLLAVETHYTPALLQWRLAGMLPFPSATAVDYQVAVLAARALPISFALGPEFARLDPFFARALSTNPGARPSGALSLVQMLDEALGSTIHAIG